MWWESINIVYLLLVENHCLFFRVLLVVLLCSYKSSYGERIPAQSESYVNSPNSPYTRVFFHHSYTPV